MKMFRYFYFFTDEEIQSPREIFHCQKRNISLLEEKYFSARREIFLCQKRNISLLDVNNFAADKLSCCVKMQTYVHVKMLMTSVQCIKCKIVCWPGIALGSTDPQQSMLPTLPITQLCKVSQQAITISKGNFFFQVKKTFFPGEENFRRENFLHIERKFSSPEKNIFLTWKENFLHLERKFFSPGQKIYKRSISCNYKKS